MISEVKEAEKRLREVQDLELKRQKASFDKEIEELKAQLNSKETCIEDQAKKITNLEQSIE